MLGKPKVMALPRITRADILLRNQLRTSVGLHILHKGEAILGDVLQVGSCLRVFHTRRKPGAIHNCFGVELLFSKFELIQGHLGGGDVTPKVEYVSQVVVHAPITRQHLQHVILRHFADDDHLADVLQVQRTFQQTKGVAKL